jgi:hypothetical protein
MATIAYEIAKKGVQWGISRNGEAGADYATAEAAFEVVAAQASIEMRSDDEITIHIRPDLKDG